MKLLVATDHHFRLESPDNFSPAPPAIVDYAFWKRYLDVFEEILVVARVARSDKDDHSTSVRADGPGVSFFSLPDYTGPWGYLRALPQLRVRVREAVTRCDAILLRVPGSVGSLVWQEARRQQKPFALEVVADPWDLLSPGAVLSIARPIARQFWSRDLRRMCQEAIAVSYVTREALQKRYPAQAGSFVTHASSIELQNGIATQPQIEARVLRCKTAFRAGRQESRPLRLGFVGMFYQLYKGPDLLLSALSRCQKSFPLLEAAFVGEGRFLDPMQELARELGLGARAHFLGSLPSGGPIYEFLDGIDLFVLPSRQEGLPRAMIEAMARGCPCVGAAVGGIPELLPAEDLVPPNDAPALAKKIEEVLSDPNRMERSIWRNWETSKQYSADVLGPRRRAFYQAVWQAASNSHSSLRRDPSGTLAP